MKNRKAMSVVVSTIIIVAVTITMAIAVSFWVMGIGASFQKYERLSIVSAYADTPTPWPVSGNQAAAIATVSGGSVNGIYISDPGSGYDTFNPPVVTISPPVNGIPANAHAIVSASGAITGFQVTYGGTGYTSAPTVTISSPLPHIVSCYPVYLQLKNTGTIASTINNLFLDSKPYYINSYQYSLVNVTLSIGQSIGGGTNSNLQTQPALYLPVGSTWNSGDYVIIEIQTVVGHMYSTTVVLP